MFSHVLDTRSRTSPYIRFSSLCGRREDLCKSINFLFPTFIRCPFWDRLVTPLPYALYPSNVNVTHQSLQRDYGTVNPSLVYLRYLLKQNGERDALEHSALIRCVFWYSAVASTLCDRGDGYDKLPLHHRDEFEVQEVRKNSYRLCHGFRVGDDTRRYFCP